MAKPDSEQGAKQGRGHDLGNDQEDAALRARLEKLSEALDATDQPAAPSGPPGGSIGQAANLGFRVLTEFVAAVLVGAVVGWQIDVWTGTKPAFLLVFLGLGTAAGFWNVYRIATEPPR